MGVGPSMRRMAHPRHTKPTWVPDPWVPITHHPKLGSTRPQSTMPSPRPSTASPLSGYRLDEHDSTSAAAYETYRALPAAEHPYSEYDLTVIAEILTLAESQAYAAARKGKGGCARDGGRGGRRGAGGREGVQRLRWGFWGGTATSADAPPPPLAGTGALTLQRLLKSYEQVLPRHQVKPEEDIYYYRCVL
jgi:hypothetical protein